MILKHLTDSLILFSWMCIITLSFKGWGCLIREWIVQQHIKRRLNLNSVFCDIWIGLCVCISLTELINFAMPINWKVSSLIMGLGLSIEAKRNWFIYYKFLFSLNLKASLSYKKCIYITAFFTLSFIWISSAMVEPNNYDSGLYHFGTIRWLNEQPIRFGLVNLHFRLAFNQSYFSLIALLNFYPLYQFAYAGTGAYLCILTVLSCANFIVPSAPHRNVLLFCMFILLSPFILKSAAPTPDLAVALFQIVIFSILIHCLHRNEQSKIITNEVNSLNFNIPLLVIICTSSVTIKLSMLMYCAGALLVMWKPIVNWVKVNNLNGLRLLIISTTMFLIHSLRGIALSGMPFFPSTFAAFWTLPYAPDISVPTNEAKWIYSWARQPGVEAEVVLQSWAWLSPWAAAQSLHFWILSIAGVSLLIVNVFRLLNSRETRINIKMYALYIPLILGVIFWFFTAPSPRFLGSIIELSAALGAWLLWPIVSTFISQFKFYTNRRALTLLGIGLLTCTAVYTLQLMHIFEASQQIYINQLIRLLSRGWFYLLTMSVAIFLICLIKNPIRTNSISHFRSPLWLSQICKYRNNYPIVFIFISTSLFILFLCAFMQYVATTKLLDVPTLNGWHPIPHEKYKSLKLISDIVVNIPISGDQCWDAPLPCAPDNFVNPNLNLESIFSIKKLSNIKMFILTR